MQIVLATSSGRSAQPATRSIAPDPRLPRGRLIARLGPAENPLALVSVYGDYTYIPTGWNANPGAAVEYGVPTSYYAAVQAIVRTRAVDDPDELASILRAQLAHFQPEGGHAPVEPASEYGKYFGSIRGIVGTIEDVCAKFKYGGNKTVEHRLRIADSLAARDHGQDAAARAQLLRRTTP